MTGGSRDVEREPGKRHMQGSVSPRSGELFVREDSTIMIVGTDDDMFGVSNPAIVSPVYRRVEFARIDEALFGRGEGSVIDAGIKFGLLKGFERRAAELATLASEAAGTGRNYELNTHFLPSRSSVSD
jgi:hypothetical protein